MGSEEKADQELGESRILLTPQTPKSSSMLTRHRLTTVLMIVFSLAKPIPSDQTDL